MNFHLLMATYTAYVPLVFSGIQIYPLKRSQPQFSKFDDFWRAIFCPGSSFERDTWHSKQRLSWSPIGNQCKYCNSRREVNIEGVASSLRSYTINFPARPTGQGKLERLRESVLGIVTNQSSEIIGSLCVPPQVLQSTPWNNDKPSRHVD